MAQEAAAVEVEQEVTPDATEQTGDESAQAEHADESAHAETEVKPPRHARMIPLPELQAERKKRQEAEAERERFRIEMEVLKRQQSQSVLPARQDPEPSDDEVWKEGPAKYIHRTAMNAAQQAAFDTRCEISRDAAQERWADYQEKENYWKQNATVADLEVLKRQANPAKFVYNWAKSHTETPKTDAEREAEIEARVLEKLRAKGIEIPADEDTEEEKPKKKPVLRSIAGNRNAQGDTAQVQKLTAVEAARKVQHGKF